MKTDDGAIAALLPQDRLTAYELVCDTLREGILNGAFPGGTRLVQADIAKQLKVSTTPVREALRDLASEGLVELDAHRGATVHRISKAELREVYELRMVLEVMAVRLAAERISGEQLARLSSLLDRLRDADDSPTWALLNRDYHMAVYEAAESPRLLRIMHGLLDASVMYASVAIKNWFVVREHAMRDHQEIYEALVRRDVEASVEITKRHLQIPKMFLETQF